MKYRNYGSVLLVLAFVLAGCNFSEAPAPTPTVEPPPSTETVAPFTVIRATRTPLPNRLPSTPTPLNVGSGGTGGSSVQPPTAVIPPTEINLTGPLPNTRLLNAGIGLSNGQVMLAGEFQVEGYCSLLNSDYRADEDGNDWYCTFNGQRALTLQTDDFSEICRLTYNLQSAYAVQIVSAIQPAYRWRCIENTMGGPTATPRDIPRLLQNGRGLTTGNPVSNGQFEVEAYCTSINTSYGVDEDGNQWYCTQNGQRILTLGRAEFDDICFRTYNTPGAFAEQLDNGEPPAYRWRCYAYN